MNSIDANAFWTTSELVVTDGTSVDQAGKPKKLGSLHTHISVQKYNETHSNGSFESFKEGPHFSYNAYIVDCVQIINLSSSADEKTNFSPKTSYTDYLVAVLPEVSIDVGTKGSANVLSFAPHTVNTKVVENRSMQDADGSVSGSVTSATSGTQDSGANTFSSGIPSTVMNALGPIGSVAEGVASFIPGVSSLFGSSSNSSVHTTTTHSNSQSFSRSQEDSVSDASSMSLKDWGAYAHVPVDSSLRWEFVQEFPWSVYDIAVPQQQVKNPSDDKQVSVTIPQGSAHRLFNEGILFPPSHLSTLGVSFKTFTRWLIRIPKDEPQLVKINQSVDYSLATHSTDATKLNVYMDQNVRKAGIASGPSSFDYEKSIEINPAVMGLRPLGAGAKNAVIGPSANSFFVRPAIGTDASLPKAFSCRSTTDNLLIRDRTSYATQAPDYIGHGIDVIDGCFACHFTESGLKFWFTGNFKIIDEDQDYTLFIKHWLRSKTSESMEVPNFHVDLGICLNHAKEPYPWIFKTVSDFEGGGGSSNLTSITLRNRDFTSIDFHDYLVRGLNQIDIVVDLVVDKDVQPKDCLYMIKALSIENVS